MKAVSKNNGEVVWSSVAMNFQIEYIRLDVQMNGINIVSGGWMKLVM